MTLNEDALVEKFGSFCPDNKTEEDLRRLIIATNGDEILIDRQIIKWWEESEFAETPNIESSNLNYNINSYPDRETTESKRITDEEIEMETQSPTNFEGNNLNERDSNSDHRSQSPTPEHQTDNNQETSKHKGHKKKAHKEEEVDETEQKPKKLKKGKIKSKSKIKVDSSHQSDFIEEKSPSDAKKKQRNSPKPKSIADSILNIDEEVVVDPAVLQEIDDTKSNRDFTEEKRDHTKNRSRSQSKKPRRERSRSRKSSNRDRNKSHTTGPRFSSQVRLLAEHCFTLSDDAIASLVRYRIPQQSRWDFKEKVQKRDDLIKHLQEALFVLNQEKQRFQSACTDIEMDLYQQNRELRRQLEEFDEEKVDPKELQLLKEQIAGAKAKLKSKEEEFMKLNQVTNDRDKKITDISKDIKKIQSELKADGEIKAQYEGRINQLKHEIEKNKAHLDEQNQELNFALQNFGEMQKESDEREIALEKAREMAEENIRVLEEEKRNLQEQLSSQSSDVALLLNELQTLKDLLVNAKEDLKLKKEQEEENRVKAQKIREDLLIEQELRAQAEQKEEEERKERITACAQLIAMETAQHENTEMKENEGDITELKERVEELTQEKEDLNNDNGRMRGKVAEMEGQVAALKTQIEDARDKTEQLKEIEELQAGIKQYQTVLQQVDAKRKKNLEEYEKNVGSMEKIVEEKENKLQLGEQERRKLQSTIQELRGNIRVYVRLRPFLPGEGDETEVDANGNPLNSYSSSSSTVEVKPDGISICIRKREESSGNILEEEAFSFDKAFAPSIGQEAIFKEVSEFVQSVSEGYNVCIFSFGQTGSGKTHTIQGSGNGPMRGIIPRAVESIAERKQALEEQGWECKIEVSYLEIDNEVLKDLLPDDRSAAADLNIKTDKKGRVTVEGLTKSILDVTDKDAIDHLMATAAKHRNNTRADTRSATYTHSICTLYITAKNTKQGYILEGQLHLCDLPGSECMENSESESKNSDLVGPNRSLTGLVDVFVAIADRRSQIPFRNSKLTQLLTPILCGEGKILMIINLSPAQTNYAASLATLRFGTNVNQCELGKAIKNVRDLDGNDKLKENSRSSAPPSKQERSASAQPTSRQPTETKSQKPVTTVKRK